MKQQSSWELGLGATILALLFGGNQVASKIALISFPPLLTAAMAFSLSTLFLGVYAFGCRIPLRPSSRLIWWQHICSALLFLAFNAAALVGLQFTLASRASILISLHPFFVILFYQSWPKAKPLKRLQWLGLASALMGLILVFSDRLSSHLALIGDGLLLLAALLLGALILHIRNVTQQVSSTQATFWQVTLSLPMFAIASICWETFPQSWNDWSAWLGVVYMGVAVNAIAFVLRARLFQRFDVNVVSSFLLMAPIFGVLLSAVSLQDPIHWRIGFGSACVALGIACVYRS